MVPRRVRFRYLDRHETLGNMDGFVALLLLVSALADC